MNLKTTTSLAEVRAKFENWRAKRKRCCLIPQYLWDAAISLLQIYPITNIVRELRINHQQLCEHTLLPQTQILFHNSPVRRKHTAALPETYNIPQAA